MATDDVGDFGYRPLLDAIYGTLIDMINHGLVREEEVRRMVIPTVGRYLTIPLARMTLFKAIES